MSNLIKKIIILLDLPIDKRLLKLVGAETLIRNGFEVEIWDLTPFFHKELLDKMVIDGHVVFNKCKKFDNKPEIIESLSKISPDTIVNLFIAYNLPTNFIYRHLSKNRIKYCVLQMISFPSPPSRPNGDPVASLRFLIKKIISLGPKHAFFGLCDKLLLRYYRHLGIRPADIALVSGERSFEIVRDPIDAKTHIIWGHIWDYDNYLAESDIQVIPDPRLGVFLDEYYPLHTDLDYLGISSPIGAEEYYLKLRTFFDHLEKTYHVRIVIAAHPRSNYPETTHYFGGRPIIKGRTAHIVHESAFVLAHDSTSINYAVLFRKPVLFITMNEMQKSDAGRLTTGLSIDSMARFLHRTPVNIDEALEFDLTEELKVDEQSYRDYQNAIIKKMGTPEIPFWEIYSQSIRQMYP